LDVARDRVAYATFTGKAAEVLRKKGNEGAITLHRLLYEHYPRPGGGFFRKKRRFLDYDIIIVDEVSMVPKSMIDLLLTYKVYIIFLGDPFQLPQIDKDEKHDLLEHPHIFLDEVMRQAAESEIIRATMKIRNMETLPFQKGQEMQILSMSDLVDGCYLWADQIITGTNITRRKINDCVRRLKGFNGNPQEGEKIICLQNYWETLSDNGDALVNGTTGILHNPQEFIQDIPYYIPSEKHEVEVILGNFKTEDGCDFWVDMDKEMITTGEFSLDWRATY
jgi:exodeoxyribonuclease-5